MSIPTGAAPPPFDVPVDVAIELCLEAAERKSSHRPHTQIPVTQAMGRHLAQTAHASWDLPGDHSSIMDGWAVRAADIVQRAQSDALMLAVAGESAAGHPNTAQLEVGTAMRISTGAVLPPGADAVVPQEETSHDPAGGQISLDATARRETTVGRYVRPAGSDVKRGQSLLDAGTRLGPGEFALLASAGAFEVSVYEPPKVALLGTGDELVPIGQTPTHGQVVSTNVPMLAAQVRHAGGEPVSLGDVGDDRNVLAAALEKGRRADLLVTTGGASVGDHDLVFAELERLGFEPIFHKIALRPGRPTFFGRLGQTLVLGLPGNPGSSHVAFELLGRPLLQALCGVPRPRCGWPRRAVELSRAVTPMRRRTKFERAALDLQAHPSSMPLARATPLTSQSSGALRSIADYDLLLRIEPGHEVLPVGTVVEALEVRW